MSLIFFPIIVSIFALAFVGYLAMQRKKVSASAEASAEVQEDAIAFLKRRYKTVSIVGIVIFILLFFLGWKVAIGFLLGAILSGLLEFLTRPNAKVGDKAKLISGLTTVGLGLLAVSGYYWLTKDINALIGLAFGTSLISVFANFSKKNGANATADIFETYVVTIVSTMILGALLFPRSLEFVYLPLILASVSLLSSIIGSYFGRSKIIWITLILSAIAFYPVVSKLMSNQAISTLNIYLAALIGLALFVAMFFTVQNPKLKKHFIVLLIALAVVVNYWLAGIYGIALGAAAMISIAGIVVEFDIYAIATAGLAALALFFVFAERISVGTSQFVLSYPLVIAGLLIGGLLPYLLLSISKRAELLPLAAPILAGFILGAEALGGMLIGATIVGLFLAISDDDASPAINSLMKSICIVSLLIIGFLV